MLKNIEMLSLGNCLQDSHKANTGKWSGRQNGRQYLHTEHLDINT